MVSQNIWIGIVVGVFFVGLGIGYVVLQSPTPASPMMMTNQQMQQMMNNPQTMNQWHQQMMQNPQAMNQWMNSMMSNPQAMQSWNQYMMQNPNMMNQWMEHMMNNQQMMQSMMNNPQFHETWMTPWLNNSTNWNYMMNSGMMGSGMMGGMMMKTPITKQNDVITTINNIENILNQVSSSYRSGDKNTAFSQATNAYLENYEYVEVAIAQKDRPLMEKIELMMRVDLRSMINNGDSADNVDAKINSIKTELGKVKTLFQ